MLDGPMPPGRRLVPLFAAVGVTAVSLIWLAAGLRPDAFYSGDSGLKLIASLSAIAHPSRPLELDLPRIGNQPVPYVEHMVAVHGTHAHVLQSPLFPVFSAPFIQALGFRGAYLLPLFSFVALVPLLDAIRRRATPETPFGLFALIAIAANPVLFYALEYWEHAPAIALMGASLAAALVARDSTSSLSWTLASGALGGGAILLRPEAAWCLAGMLFILERRRWLPFAAAVAAALLPFGITNLMHSGTLLGPHASNSLAPLQHDWLNARWSRLDAWLWPNSYAVAAGLLLLALAWVTAIVHVDLRIRQILALLGTATVAVAAAERWPVRDSLWQAFPVALLALVPAASTPIVRRLAAMVVVTLAAIVLTATHDGGAQWGPRFVLIATPPLVVLAARGGADAMGPGRARWPRIGLTAVVLFAAVMTTRASYRELRGAKRLYGEIVSATSTLTNDGDVIVTNVWWFDQVNASLFGRRTFLFVPTRTEASHALNALARAGTVHTRLVWTDEADGESLAPATAGTCFHITGVQPIRERGLQVASARCEAP
jgi:hypothetical protein